VSSVGNCPRAKWKTAGSEIRAPPRVRTPDDIIPRFPLASELLRHSRIDARVESISDRPAYRCIGLRWGDFETWGFLPLCEMPSPTEMTEMLRAEQTNCPRAKETCSPG